GAARAQAGRSGRTWSFGLSVDPCPPWNDCLRLGFRCQETCLVLGCVSTVLVLSCLPRILLPPALFHFDVAGPGSAGWARSKFSIGEICLHRGDAAIRLCSGARFCRGLRLLGGRTSGILLSNGSSSSMPLGIRPKSIPRGSSHRRLHQHTFEEELADRSPRLRAGNLFLCQASRSDRLHLHLRTHGTAEVCVHHAAGDDPRDRVGTTRLHRERGCVFFLVSARGF